MSVDTFPHHKHTADGKIISVHNVPGLEAALREIETLKESSEDM